MARFINNPEITCTFCGNTTENPLLALGEQRMNEIVEAHNSGAMIQQAAPELSAEDRELLISGMCLNCQKQTFGDWE